jgi:hypothetical protein
MAKNVLILERSSENLKKVSQKGKTVLEGVFCEFGLENRNGRVYEEKEYLPHMEYLKKDIANGALLGELDHPERFEVALTNVSHRVTDLWYDQNARQVKGRVEILEGTPRGQIAKSLLDAGIPLSISSRAAGTVNDDKTVAIQQIYTYDLVAKPGFENAQLSSVNEGVQARIKNQIKQLNESQSKFNKDHENISPKLGIVNENVSIYDLSDKYPALSFRKEAQELVKNKSEKMEMEKENIVNEKEVQQWTVYFKNELSKLDERFKAIENAILEGATNKNDVKTVKGYVEKLREIQEKHLNWTSSIAEGVNKVATHSQSMANKSNDHYKLTKKMSDVVDYNAKVLNHTQDWIGHNANVTNAIAETVDHNAKMLNGINEWNTQLAKGVNALHEWGSEKAKAINEMHEWTSSIAKNLNLATNWSEEMFGRALSKADAKKLLEYIELVSESKADPELKKKLDEILQKNGITEEPLNESMITGIKGVPALGVITDVTTIGTEKVDTDTKVDSGVEFDTKSKTIVAKIKKGSRVTNERPKELKTIEDVRPGGKITSNKVKGIMTLDVVKSGPRPTVKIVGDGPLPKHVKGQNLKLDQKPIGKLKEDAPVVEKPVDKFNDVVERRSKLDEKLSKIIENLEKEKKLDEEQTKKYPFLTLLTEDERKKFGTFESTEKEKVEKEIAKNPTTDPDIIRSLMESALATKKVDETPLWLKAAPKKYLELFEKAPDEQKGAIKARAEFYELDTQYKINNFWETSGLEVRPTVTLNEAVYAKSPKEAEQKLDTFVAAIGDAMKRYN